MPLDLKIVDGAHGGAGLGAHRADGGKVVGAHKLRGRLGHDLLVQQPGVKPHPVDEKWVPDAGVVDFIGVLLFEAGADGVKAAGHHRGLEHRDIVGQAGIHRQGEPLHGDAGGGAEVGHIYLGVHPRVGAARPGDLDGMAYHRGQGLFQGLRHGDGVFLHLPAVVGGAGVAQPESDVAFHVTAPNAPARRSAPPGPAPPG